MAEDEPGSGQPELAAILPLPVRTDPGPASPADLAAAMAPDSERLAAALEADPASAALRRAFGLGER